MIFLLSDCVPSEVIDELNRICRECSTIRMIYSRMNIKQYLVNRMKYSGCYSENTLGGGSSKYGQREVCSKQYKRSFQRCRSVYKIVGSKQCILNKLQTFEVWIYKRMLKVSNKKAYDQNRNEPKIVNCAVKCNKASFERLIITYINTLTNIARNMNIEG